MYKSPDSDQIPAIPIQARGEILRSKIHKLTNSIWNKEELPGQRKESIILPVHKMGGKTGCTNSGIACYHSVQNLLSCRLL
jgi:hypothetical protein